MEIVIFFVFAFACLAAIVYYANRSHNSKPSAPSLTDDSSTSLLNTALLGGESGCSSHSHSSHGHGSHHTDTGSHHSGFDSGHSGGFDAGGHH
jgi:hypothetical protein